MTSYNYDTSSVQGSRPVELYVFSVAGDTYYYTSRETSIIYGGNTHSPAVLVRNETAVPTLTDTPELVLELPVTDEMITAYGFWVPPPQNFLCTVYRYEITSAVAVIIWQGKVGGITIEGSRARVLIPSLLGDALETTLGSRYFGQQCQHSLFDSMCGLVRADYTHPTTVVSVSGKTVIVASLGSSEARYYVTGKMQRTNDSENRMIVDQDGTTLTLNVAFNTLNALDNIQIVAGCDKLVKTCRDKYGNVRRFGGHPDIPSKDPFEPHRQWWNWP